MYIIHYIETDIYVYVIVLHYTNNMHFVYTFYTDTNVFKQLDK